MCEGAGSEMRLRDSKAIRLMFDKARSEGCHGAYLNVYYKNEDAIEAGSACGYDRL